MLKNVSKLFVLTGIFYSMTMPMTFAAGDASLKKRDEIFEQADYVGQDTNASTSAFLFASKKRLQFVDQPGNFIPEGHEKLTHKNGIVFKGTYFASQPNQGLYPGLLNETEVPVIVSFATVGDNIKAPGLSFKFFDLKGDAQDVLSAASVADLKPWSTPMSNVLPAPSGAKEWMVIKKFSSAADTKYLSVAHLSPELKRIEFHLSKALSDLFYANDPSDFTLLEATDFSASQEGQYIDVYASKDVEGSGKVKVGVIKLSGVGKRNQTLRFQHHLINKK